MFSFISLSLFFIPYLTSAFAAKCTTTDLFENKYLTFFLLFKLILKNLKFFF